MIKLSSLSSDSEFKKLLKLNKINNDYFTIYFGKIYSNAKKNLFKISIVTKKKIGTAVKRNRIKRKLKSAIQAKLKKNTNNNYNYNYGYLVIAKSKAYQQKFSILLDQISKTFDKINIIIN